MERLENIPIELDAGEIEKKLRLDSLKEVQALIETALPLLKAKAVYRVCYVEARFEDAIVLDGARFTSRVLKTNLERAERAFLYVVTIGHELDWDRPEERRGCRISSYYGHHPVSVTEDEDVLGPLMDWAVEEMKRFRSAFQPHVQALRTE